jgi:DNA-binding response OmpR family regulator/DNA-binding MarR family transcriptional regulator
MSKDILLLDDDPAMLGILEEVLQSSGYHCVTAQRADLALALIVEHPEIAVVISDIIMPETSGLEFVSRLNALDLRHAPPRVLLLTGQPTLEAAVDALRLGVRDFLAKPIRPADLVEAVQRVMEQVSGDRSTAGSRPKEVEDLMRQAGQLAMKLRTLASTSGEDAAPRVARMAVARARMTGVPARQSGPARAGAAALSPAVDESPELAVLETIEHLRRLRAHYAQHRLDDVAWELLLELLRAERLRQRLSVSGLAISVSGVSPTTSQRRINELTSRGYMERIADPQDARRDFVILTGESRALLSDYLARADVYVSARTG